MKKNTQIIITLTVILLFSCQDEYSNGQTTQSESYQEESYNVFPEIIPTEDKAIYTSLTKQDFDTIDNNDIESKIFEDISNSLNVEEEYRILQKLTKGQLAIFSTWIIEGEVNNGGFNQLYYNSSGQYSEIAVLGFKTIGSANFSNLMLEANKIHTSIKQDLEKFNDGTLESFSKSYEDNPLNELDTKFYSISENESLSDLRVEYIRNNINEFVK